METSDHLQEWTAQSSNAVHLNFSRSGAFVFPDAFHPRFTHAIFGDEEMIPGYKNLKISLTFQAHDLKPSLDVKYSQKMEAVNEEMAEMMDIEGALQKFLPKPALLRDTGEIEGGHANGASEANESLAAWKPPGELLHSYTTRGKQFEIWTSPLSNLRTREIVGNMCIFIPFFIEGGTIDFLDSPASDFERWKIFLLYEVFGQHYTLAGFASSYRLWVFPTTDVLTCVQSQSPTSELLTSQIDPREPGYSNTDHLSNVEQRSFSSFASRERISQFMILPPYQHASHGTWLYTAMTSVFRLDNWVFEITVEEPNEEFDALRDYCDLAYLYSLPQIPGTKSSFKDLALPENVDLSEFRDANFVPTDKIVSFSDLDAIRHYAKMAPRQFMRCVEIHLLSSIPPRHRNMARITRKAKSADKHDRAYYFWRLLLKERIFIKNRDQLLQIDEAERVEKVEETVGGVQEEYVGRIESFANRMEQGLGDVIKSFHGDVQAEAGAGKDRTGRLRRKRKIVTEDDGGDGVDENPRKKVPPSTL